MHPNVFDVQEFIKEKVYVKTKFAQVCFSEHVTQKKKLMQQNNRTNEKDVFNIINETITYNLQSICEISSGLSR